MSSVPITMERIIKTEMQPDGQVLLYYVDENGATEQGILTTMEEGDGQVQGYTLVEEMDSSMIQYEVTQMQEEEEQEHEAQDIEEQNPIVEGVQWTDEETKRCLIFYNDNKETFRSGQVDRKHLWNAACKTMIIGKNPEACENYLQVLKQKYAEVHLKKILNNEPCNWQFYERCHQVFNDDPYVQQLVNSYITNGEEETPVNDGNDDIADSDIISIVPDNGMLTIGAKKVTPDPNVTRMLQLYAQYKNAVPRTIWQKIAIELGDTADYWHKRFLNYKSHYIKLLDKHKGGGLTQNDTSWPYLEIFEKIYQDDREFQRKYGIQLVQEVESKTVQMINHTVEWDNTEMTVLVKYCFDSFDEFQDPTIPNNYLWGEIGRILDKKAEICEEKYNELKILHLTQYIEGVHNLSSRKPIGILYDNIIHKETKKSISDYNSKTKSSTSWTTEEVDALVQFVSDNLELFKDEICHYVCWAAISKHLSKSLHACLSQTKDLTTLYKTILNDKKENPEMQIDWRYTDMFDRIFDYGMDTNLITKIEESIPQNTAKDKQTNGESNDIDQSDDDDESSVNEKREKHGRGIGDPKQFKILEFYIKNKDKFGTGPRFKKVQWTQLAKEIGLSNEQCLHRFRNLKQVYLAQIEREMNTPDKPILWPYYALCKKAFGYRDIKNKVKSKTEPYISGEWTPKEIKQLISHFGKHYDPVTKSEVIDWSEVAQELKRTDSACKEKFVDLRKSYRQIKTMVSRGGNCRVTWKYYKLIDAVYNKDSTAKSVPLEETVQEDNSLEEVNSIEENNSAVEDESVMEEDSTIENQNVTETNIAEEMENNETLTQNSAMEVPEMEVPLNNIKQEDNIVDYEMEIDGICTNTVPQITSNDENLAQDSDILGQFEEFEMMEEDLESDGINPENFITNNQYKAIQSWSEEEKTMVLKEYLNNITAIKQKLVKLKDLWPKIAETIPDRSEYSCKQMFCKLKQKYFQLKDNTDELNNFAQKDIMKEILDILGKNNIDNHDTKMFKEAERYTDVEIPLWVTETALKYYLEHIEEFLSPKYVKEYVWKDLCKHVNSITHLKINENKIFKKINYLKEAYSAGNKNIIFADLVNQILIKEFSTKITLDIEPIKTVEKENVDVTWSDTEVEVLLKAYLDNLDKFKNPKYVTSYIWEEISDIVNKEPLACSNKMAEMRQTYRMMVKERSEILNKWYFYDLCRKIYGDGYRKIGNGDSDD